MQYQRQYYREQHFNKSNKKTVNGNTLAKDNLNKKISGVCAGIANYYGYPRWGIRIAALFALFTVPMAMIIAYFVASIIMPKR